MILGHTLTTFPKVTTYIFMHNQRRNKDYWHNCKRNKEHQTVHLYASMRTLHNWWRISRHQGFYTAREKLNKDKEGGNLQPSKQQEKGQH